MQSPTVDLNALLDNRADPDSRSVLEDLTLSRGVRATRMGLALSIIDDAADDDVADDAADDAAADDVDDDDADDDAADDAAADDAADDADDDDAADDADDANADDYHHHLTSLLLGDPDMNDGFKLISLPGGYYGRSLNRIGWLRRVSGDEWELLGGRTIIRVDGAADIGAMEKLAANGLGRKHKLSDATGTVEEIHRLVIRRSRVADPSKWPQIPKPADWEEPS